MGNSKKGSFDWNELLEQIHEKNVIPVIGQDLYCVRTDENKEVLLYDYLAEKLAKEMEIPKPADGNHRFSKVVSEYLEKKNNNYLGLRRFLTENLATLRPSLESPLLKLARIKPFSLFINTSYDPLLENSLNMVRDYSTEVLHHTYREKRINLVTFEKLKKLEKLNSSLVINIFGSTEKNLHPSYTDDDIIETLVSIQKDREIEIKNPLFQLLKEKSLLFIGCGYDDWLFRFFIRTLSNNPFQASENLPRQIFIVDDLNSFNYSKLTSFLNAYNIQGLSSHSKNFVELLYKKMTSRDSQFLILEEKSPRLPGTVFISFHGADRAKAKQLALNLREDGVDVWLDDWKLRPGDRLDKSVVNAIAKYRVFVPIISENAKQVQRLEDNELKYHIREWEWAYSRKVGGENPRLIIPVKIDNTNWMYRAFSDLFYINIPGGNRRGGYEQLRSRLLEVGEPIETISFENPPLEIENEGEKAINIYRQSLTEGEIVQFKEVKLIVVGEALVGKTSLVKCLLDKEINKHEKRTDGIEINLWTVKDENHGNEIQVRIWDFGGQEIMHATHQFFLSKRSFYILVLDEKNDEKMEYWLNFIKIFGGESPVMVVLNKIDITPEFHIDQKSLKKNYKNIINSYRISCESKEGIDIFIAALKNALLQAEILKTDLLANWFRVKTHLENIPEHYISYEKFREICSAEKVIDESSQDILLNYLNDLGIIIYYKNINLQGIHVLKPQWVTEGVYKIITSEKLAKSKGILKQDSLMEIFKEENETSHKYPTNIYTYLIQLMKKFGLCYEINEQILIPGLLSDKACNFDFDYRNALKLIIQYDFLPKSIMPNFIVQMHQDIKEELRWRTGVVLEEKKDFPSMAVVKTDEKDRRIYIYVNGEKKRHYLEIILHEFRKIHKNFEKLEIQELVPLPRESNKTVEYLELIGLEELRVPYLFLGKLAKIFYLKELLEGVETKEPSEKEICHFLENFGNKPFEKKEDKNMPNINFKGDITVERGNVIIGEGSNQFIGNVKQSNLEGLLEELHASVKKMQVNLSPVQVEKVNKAIKAFSDEALSQKPQREWWELSAKGLKEAAHTVGDIGISVIKNLDKIIPILEKLS